MNKAACLDVLKAAVGDKVRLTDEELNGVLREIERRTEVERGKGNLDDVENVVFDVTGRVIDDMKRAAILEKRKAALNVLRREALHERISRFKDPVEGLKAVMVGIQKPLPGARQSVDSAYLALARKFQGGMLSDLRRAGLLEVLNSRAIDRDIARELWEIRPDGSPGISGSREAREIAAIVNKWQKETLTRLNRAGAYVQELKGYIVRQSHDFRKVTKAGFDNWKEFIARRLDYDRTIGTGNPDEVLPLIYSDLVKGKQLLLPEDQLVRPGRGPDIARKVSEHREIHFRDADSWFEYNQRFGNKSIGESAFSALDQAARNIALLEAFGPEPEAMLKTVIQDLVDKADVRTKPGINTVAALRGETRAGQMLQLYFDELSGKTNIKANNLTARVGRGWRALNTLSKLGLATVSSITDVATKAAELNYQGVNLLEAYARSLADILQGRGGEWKREFADLLGAGFEGALGDVHGRFTTTDDLPGGMTKAMQLFFKWNGLNWWTDANKTGTILMLARHLGLQGEKSFEALPVELQRSLPMYGIDGGRWGLLRTLVKEAPDGRKYLSPEGIADLPSKAVREAFGAPRANEREVLRMKDELETSLRAYLADRTDHAIFSPGAYEKTIATLGTQAGTPLGEAVRMLMQFKQFSITGISRGLGRAIYGKGADTIAQALFKGKADFVGLAHLMVSTTVFGYLAMAAKDIIKGKTPRDPKDPKTWVSSFVQGGGAGILGDFVFGEFNRFGSSFLSSMTGPAAGQVESLAELWAKFRSGDDAAAQAVKFVINNTPFINLAYVRPALDYLFLYHVQEALNPGYLRRMERRFKKENDQVFLFPPSRYAVGAR